MVDLLELAAYLDDLLGIHAVPDYPEAHNGLQVENAGRVTRVATAVDASEATVAAALDVGADLLLVHHGVFWGAAIPITGRRYRKLRALIGGGLAVYAAHLPLDAHATLGNNISLLKALGIEPAGRFGCFREVPIGWWGETDASRDEIAAALVNAVGGDPFAMPFGPERVKRVGVVTGGGGSFISEAKDAQLDLFVTGEGAHHTYFEAQELEINVLYGGHYATETFGVKNAGNALAEYFDLPWSFLDFPTGL